MRGPQHGELFHEGDRYYAAIGVASAFNGVDPQLGCPAGSHARATSASSSGRRRRSWTSSAASTCSCAASSVVTEREWRREHDLRSREERLRATIGSLSVAVLEVDLDDRISLWNPSGGADVQLDGERWSAARSGTSRTRSARVSPS
jgi:PAS domain-containing protein